MYEKDPFIDAERDSEGSTASSRFAASSVVTTVCRSKTRLPTDTKAKKCTRPNRHTTADGKTAVRLPAIKDGDDDDDDGDIVLDNLSKTLRRPPSYEYDLDEKLTSEQLPSTHFNQE